MFERFIEWLTDGLPANKIDNDDGSDYLLRFFLFRIPFTDITFFIHKFLDSDDDRGLHDHPWNWSVSVILVGSYIEHFLTKWNEIMFRTRDRFKPKLIKGNDFHRVELQRDEQERNKPVWTLFIHGTRTKTWGFMINPERNDGMVVSYRYDIVHDSVYRLNSKKRSTWKIQPKGRDIKIKVNNNNEESKEVHN